MQRSNTSKATAQLFKLAVATSETLHNESSKNFVVQMLYLHHAPSRKYEALYTL